ncbi:MAG: DUF493 domain-containing protein [Pseudomonadota bacterium]
MSGGKPDSPETTGELLEFPCHIDVKATGRAEAGFETLVLEIVRRHIADFDDNAVSTRPSRNGNYLAVTVRVYARSREQIDAVYRDLTAHDRVIIAL